MESMRFTFQGNEYEVEFRHGRAVRVLEDDEPVEGETLLMVMAEIKAMLEALLDRHFPHTQPH